MRVRSYGKSQTVDEGGPTSHQAFEGGAEAEPGPRCRAVKSASPRLHLESAVRWENLQDAAASSSHELLRRPTSPGSLGAVTCKLGFRTRALPLLGVMEMEETTYTHETPGCRAPGRAPPSLQHGCFTLFCTHHVPPQRAPRQFRKVPPSRSSPENKWLSLWVSSQGDRNKKGICQSAARTPGCQT